MSLPPENVTIQRASARDFAAVSQLLAELGRPAPAPEIAAKLNEVYLSRIGRPDVADLVAELSGAVVGFCSLEFRARLNFATPEAWIPDLIVTDSARGRGIGRLLLEAAAREGKRRGAHRLTLESGYTRTVAHRLYASAGMTDAGRFFIMRL